jgi:hypothetical protein
MFFFNPDVSEQFLDLSTERDPRRPQIPCSKASKCLMWAIWVLDARELLPVECDH